MYAFRSVLIQLPKHYWKSKKAREKPILTVIAEAKAKAKAEAQDKAQAGKKEDKGTSKADYVRVGPVTVNKHLSMISPIFEWCQTSGDLPENGERFWTRLHLKTGKKVTGLKKNQERPAFTHAQIKKIFEHYVWTRRRAPAVRSSEHPSSSGSVWSPKPSVCLCRHGQRQRLAYRNSSAAFRQRRDALRQQVDAHLKRLLGRAKRIIETDRDAVIQLTERLMDEKVLSGQEIAEALGSAKPSNHSEVDPRAGLEFTGPGLGLK